MGVRVGYLETVFIGATALFTGVSAYVAWRNHTGGLSLEIVPEVSALPNGERRVLIVLTARNTTARRWRLSVVEIRGAPGAQLTRDAHHPKHDSWPANQCPLEAVDLEPGRDKRTPLAFDADWAAWSKSWSRRWPRRRKSASLCIIILYAKPLSSIRRPRRHVRIIAIPAHVIESNAKALAA